MTKNEIDELKKIFSTNLQYYMDLKNVTVADLSSKLGIPYTTIADWYHGRKYPRMDKVQLLADYFEIMKSDLTEKKEAPMPKHEGKRKAVYDLVDDLPVDALDETISYLSYLSAKHKDSSKKND